MKKFTILIIMLAFAATYSFGQTEIFYDEDTYTGWQERIPERTYAVHMSPTGPCEVLVLKYYVEKVGASEGIFFTSLHTWEGSQPGVNAVYEQATAVVTEGWKEQNVEGDITFDGDFVVGYTPKDQAAYLAIDADLETGRNWVLDITNSVWSEVTSHAYLIRAVVEYSTGEIEELEGIPVKIYPNPATKVLNIKASEKVQQASLINLVGQVVFEQQIESQITSINLENMEPGIYFLRIKADTYITTRKILIQ